MLMIVWNCDRHWNICFHYLFLYYNNHPNNPHKFKSISLIASEILKDGLNWMDTLLQVLIQQWLLVDVHGINHQMKILEQLVQLFARVSLCVLKYYSFIFIFCLIIFTWSASSSVLLSIISCIIGSCVFQGACQTKISTHDGDIHN